MRAPFIALALAACSASSTAEQGGPDAASPEAASQGAGGNQHPQDEAAADVGSGEDSIAFDAVPSETGPGSLAKCDTALQDCNGAETCDLVCDAANSKVECRSVPDTPVAIGSTCVSTDDCGHNAGCYAASGQGSTCRQYCGGVTDCPPGTTCEERPVKRACGPADMTYMLKICFGNVI